MAVVDEQALGTLFLEARSQNGWQTKEVTDAQLREAWDIAKWGPTSMNTQPLRILFLRSTEAKERLKPAVMPGNHEKTMTAPVVAIMAYDSRFYDHMERNFPHNPQAGAFFGGNEPLAAATAFRNGTLQAAYFLLALRAVGLDAGPMSGFDNAKLDAEFFSDSSYKSNFIMGIGNGDPEKVRGRLPRFAFEEATNIL